MTDSKTIRDVVDKSYARCMASAAFIDDFYLEFLSSSPRVVEKFLNTSPPQQKRLLDQGVRLLLQFYHEPNAVTALKMSEVGETHARSSMNIEPELYELWLSALIQAVAKHDPNCDADVASAWRKVADHGIAALTSMYED